MAIDKEKKDDWRHVASTATLLAAVLGTLVLGAALRLDPNEREDSVTLIEPGTAETERTPTPVEYAPTPSRPEDESPAADPTDIMHLAQRARDDARRLSAPGEAWTLQFMVTRRADTASRVLQDVGDDPNLHLLPMLLDDQPCFRICWGNFDSRERAATSRGIPPALTALNHEPIPRPIADLLP